MSFGAGQNIFPRLVTPSRSPSGSSIVPSVRASSSARSWATTGARASRSVRQRCRRVPPRGLRRFATAPAVVSRAPTSSVPLVVAQARDTPDAAACASAVHSVNRTCATRSGRTQCAGSFGLDRFRERRLVRSRAAFSSFQTRASSAWSKPVPVWPTYVERPPALLVVHAEQQRAEVLARLSRLGPAADDELLLAAGASACATPGCAGRTDTATRASLTIRPSHPSSRARGRRARGRRRRPAR